MSALTSNTVQSTYQSLLKTVDNGIVSSSLKTITDGLGNLTAMSLDDQEVSVTGALTVGGSIVLNGNAIDRPYKVYTALLTQDGTPDTPPTAYALEDTLGISITYGYVNLGNYTLNLATPIDPTTLYISLAGNANVVDSIATYSYATNTATISVINIAAVKLQSGFPHEDGLLYKTPIEIRVYNSYS